MTENAREIPALPAVILLTVAGTAAVLWWLHRRGSATWPRTAVGVVACVYAAGVLDAVLLPFPLGTEDSYQVPWRVFVNLTPLRGTEPIDMILNVALFVPLGVLLPLMARVSSALRVLLVGLVLSLSIEVVQLVSDVTGHGGHAADLNDLLANTVGALVGYLVFRVAVMVPPVARIAATATWPAPEDDGPTIGSPLAGRGRAGACEDWRRGCD